MIVLFRWLLAVAVTTMVVLWSSASLVGQEDHSRFATSGSRSDYVHRITLYDSRNSAIGPGKSTAPYSSLRTCGRCHDVDLISHGYHFLSDETVQVHGRPGEPWVWVDPTTGTQLPLSYREWPGSLSPEKMGITPWEFVLQFGGRTCGGYPSPESTTIRSATAATDADDEEENSHGRDRFHLSGPLEVDCMVCHVRGSSFDIEEWSRQISNENFAWASTAALGLAKVEGAVKRLKDDFDPASSEGNGQLPTAEYDADQFDADGLVFFDIVRSPPNDACYRCHSELAVGQQSTARWTHDQDVHLAAGLQCVDCHRNGLAHDTVRGFEGEVHPHQEYVTNLSCRGCHLGPGESEASYTSAGGRLGAPYPEHRGLPPVHLEQLTCTACHAGPPPKDQSGLVQTSRNHLLGQKGHRKAHQQPEVVQPVLMPNQDGVLAPHRVVWPSYWGIRADSKITPLPPAETQETLRRVLRVRRDFVEEMTRVRLSSTQKKELLGEERGRVPASELTEEEQAKLAEFEQTEGRKEFHEKMTAGLQELQKEHEEGEPVYVAGEKIYQLDAEGKLQIVDNANAQPYAWPLGHDVRPARWSLGANGCTDCHTEDAAFINGTVVAQAPVPDSELASRPMHTYARLDAALMRTWGKSFLGRTAFKWSLIAAVACLSGVLLVGGTAWWTARTVERRLRP